MKFWCRSSDLQFSWPSLSVSNAPFLERIGIVVQSVSLPPWVNRSTNFVQVMLGPLLDGSACKWTFQRIMLSIISEFHLSRVQVEQSLIPTFSQQARSYGRLWDNFNMFGSEPFGPNTIIQRSTVGDDGLLTFAHTKIKSQDRVRSSGKNVLLSRSWVGTGALADFKAKTNVPDWANPFLKSLELTDVMKAIDSERPLNPQTKKVLRIHLNVFIIVVIIGIFCRLRHLHYLIGCGDCSKFLTLLYLGCQEDIELKKKELSFLPEINSLTTSMVKEILAFWQSGVLGMHSSNTIKDKISAVASDSRKMSFVTRLLKEELFQIDRDWLLNRPFMKAYRENSKTDPLILPTWVDDFVKDSDDIPSHMQKHWKSLSHVSADWILPRTIEENETAQNIPENLVSIAIRAVWKPFNPSPSSSAEYQIIDVPVHTETADWNIVSTTRHLVQDDAEDLIEGAIIEESALFTEDIWNQDIEHDLDNSVDCVDENLACDFDVNHESASISKQV